MDEDEAEVVLPSVAKDAVEVADFCSLADSKPTWPTDSNSLSATGVPPGLNSENQPTGRSRQSTYFCLFGEPCQVYTHQKASLMAHIRRMHLGASVACKFCDARWWTTAPFTKHMERKHPEVEPPARWTPVEPKKIVAEEKKEAAEMVKAATTSSTPLM